MPSPKDTLLRQITLLQLIPRMPGKMATTTLCEKLHNRGYTVNIRTVQRDLTRLSTILPLICHEEELPYRWSFEEKAHIDLPALDTPSALTLYLAETHLRGLLPQSVADQLNPQFHAARVHLEQLEHNGIAHWAKIVRALPNGKALLPAAISNQVWRSVTEALLEQRQLKITYHSRKQGEVREYLLHPAGLVSRYSISYLVAVVDGYSNLRQFALHRILQAERLEAPAQPAAGFDIDRYIQEGAFASRQCERNTQLVADIHPQIAWLLRETPLSTEQTITTLPNSNWERLEATVPLDNETLWWIYGLNENIRVHAPEEWVKEIRETLGKMVGMYAP
jgi:predicted DNA-binding transcriptional regulator YafY